MIVNKWAGRNNANEDCVRIIKNTEAAVNSGDKGSETAARECNRLLLQLAGRRDRKHIAGMKEFALRPKPDDPALTERVAGTDHNGDPVEAHVVVERPQPYS